MTLKKSISIWTVFFCLTLTAHAQDVTAPIVEKDGPKAGGAFLRSLVLPGWGHQYAQEGSWRGMATVYVGADIALWLSLINASWQQDNLIESYETLAASRAGADIVGKDRAFFLNLATFLSSDEYLDFQLRNRFWNRIDYVEDPSFQWAWSSEEDFQNFRGMREDAETFRRRRGVFIALLVANRLLSGITATGKANRTRGAVELSLSAPPMYEKYPILNARIKW